MRLNRPGQVLQDDPSSTQRWLTNEEISQLQNSDPPSALVALFEGIRHREKTFGRDYLIEEAISSSRTESRVALRK